MQKLTFIDLPLDNIPTKGHRHIAEDYKYSKGLSKQTSILLS